MSKDSNALTNLPSLAILVGQRSHILLVLANAKDGKDDEFSTWLQGPFTEKILARPEVISVRHACEDDVDVTGGAVPRLPFRFLSIHELSIDGAEEAENAIAEITALYKNSGCADRPATWLYFPVSERTGRSAADAQSVTIAFANGVLGQENEFREWYATRHIRHALNISALANGQCFERTLFQRPGAYEANFQIIAIYEQTGLTKEIIEAFNSLPPEAIAFPTLDLSRFAEVSYRLLD